MAINVLFGWIFLIYRVCFIVLLFLNHVLLILYYIWMYVNHKIIRQCTKIENHIRYTTTKFGKYLFLCVASSQRPGSLRGIRPAGSPSSLPSTQQMRMHGSYASTFYPPEWSGTFPNLGYEGRFWYLFGIK